MLKDALARTPLVMLAILGVLGAAIVTPVDAQTTLRLGWTTADAPQDPYAITARRFKELVEERTDGRYRIALFPNNQLGDERAMIEAMGILGTLDMGVITNAPISGFVPAFQVLDMPFLFADAKQAHKILDGPIGQELLAKLEPIGIKGLGFSEGGFRYMINNVRPIKTPSDVQGVKFRVMENPVYIQMFQALGSNPTPMAWGETFTAVQQGTIDGLEIPIPVIHQNKYYEVTRYLSLTRHTYSPLVVMVSMQTWERLPEEDQVIFQEAAREAIEYTRVRNEMTTARLLKELQDLGMQVNDIENPALFREMVRPVYERFRDQVGPDLMDRVLAAVSE
ncbi:MAG: DctP family TRAP transporter solute-binding subunit [Firmicutes bacterium]|nr:DctP family TRAP transporter solute-binding subunit [Bacillota bacterium]